MISGSVTAGGIPIVSLRVAGKSYRAVIDTGFNGDLELPESLRKVVKARWVFRAESQLAGGVSIEEDVFEVRFPFDGQSVKAEATFVAGTHILLGTNLLKKYRLTIDFAARNVQIERSTSATN